MSTRTWGVVALACALPLILTGCGKEPVTIDSPTVDAATATACRALLDVLPKTLDDQDKRLVSPADALGAAWGDPAIVVRCGVGKPAGLNRFSACQQADGVGYFLPPAQADDSSTTITLTTLEYDPRLEVTVPPDYRPEGVAAAMAQLAGPVKAHFKLVHPCR
ncbi:MAG: DUF3515 domain-containing protein [Nocardioides sp.]